MKNFIIEKYYGTNTYLRHPLNLEDPNWFRILTHLQIFHSYHFQ